MYMSKEELRERLILIRKTARKYQKEKQLSLQEDEYNSSYIPKEILSYRLEGVEYFNMNAREKNHILGD